MTTPEGREVAVLTLDQVADLLQVSRRTVNRLVREGRLRPARIGRSPRVTPQELAAYVSSLDRQKRR